MTYSRRITQKRRKRLEKLYNRNYSKKNIKIIRKTARPKFIGLDGLNFNCSHNLLYIERNFFKKNYREIHKRLEYIKNACEEENGFKCFPKKDKETIFRIYNLNNHYRWIIKKCVFKWRVKQRQKRLHSQNSVTLNLDSISELDDTYKIEVYCDKTDKLYTFDYLSIMLFFKELLESESYGRTTPEKLKNPYTNTKFSLKQLISIFDRLNDILNSKNIRLPLILLLFKKSRYNIPLFCQNNKRYLGLKACSNYVKNMDVEYFDTVLENIIKVNYKRIICLKCIKELDNYRVIFEPSIIRYMIERNIIGETLEYIYMLESLFENYDLYVDVKSSQHYMKHRKPIRVHHTLKRNRYKNRQAIVFRANRC